MYKASVKTFLLVLLLLSQSLFADNSLIVGETSGEYFTVQIRQESHSPLSINTFHRWQIKLLNLHGEFIEDADIKLTGGMPTHNHGLPTSPKVTQYLGQGRYLIEGIKFHMQGDWLLNFVIRADGKEEKLSLNLHL